MLRVAKKRKGSEMSDRTGSGCEILAQWARPNKVLHGSGSQLVEVSTEMTSFMISWNWNERTCLRWLPLTVTARRSSGYCRRLSRRSEEGPHLRVNPRLLLPPLRIPIQDPNSTERPHESGWGSTKPRRRWRGSRSWRGNRPCSTIRLWRFRS